MRIGLYGGTFDPVHLGHVHAALAVHQHLSLDRVHMILSARPSHRQQPLTTNAKRWEMLQLACSHHDALVADDTELRREGKSYAVETLRQFRMQYADDQLCWIMGMDSYVTLPTWERWQSLLCFGHLVVLQRPEHEAATDAMLQAYEDQYRSASLEEARFGKIVLLPLPMRSIAASQIRAMREQGRDVAELVDQRVCSYIKQHELYLTQEGSFESE